MYQSPISIDYSDPIFEQVTDAHEQTIFRAIMNYNVRVDKDELVKALEYDRGQYDLGYNDGLREGKKILDARREQHTLLLGEIHKIMSDILLVLSNGEIRPVKNTSKTECYNALYKIQKLLKTDQPFTDYLGFSEIELMKCNPCKPTSPECDICPFNK